MSLTPNEIKLKINDLGKEQASELLMSIYSSSNDFQEREQAIELLAEIGGEKNFKIIENALLSDENPYVRILAAKVIGKYYKDRAVEPLRWALKDKSANVFKNACNELLRKSPKKIIDILINNLSSYSPTFRSIATEILIKIGEPAIKPLINSLSSEDFNTRKHALKALQKINDIELVKTYIQEIIASKSGFEKDNLLSILNKIDKLNYK